jgi:hypothetical protein
MTRWQGGHLDQGDWVWVLISFEHPTKGEIRSGVVVAMMLSVGNNCRYVVQVPGVGYITGLQSAEISPMEFGKPSGSVVASEAVLFKASKAAVGVRQVRYVFYHISLLFIHCWQSRQRIASQADEAVVANPGITKTLPASRPNSRRRVYNYDHENCMYDVLSCVYLCS